jgi:hypothetical protein
MDLISGRSIFSNVYECIGGLKMMCTIFLGSLSELISSRSTYGLVSALVSVQQMSKFIVHQLLFVGTRGYQEAADESGADHTFVDRLGWRL